MKNHIALIFTSFFLFKLCGAEIEDVLLERNKSAGTKFSEEIKDDKLRRIFSDALEEDYLCRLLILRLSRSGIEGIGKFSVEIIQKIDNESVAARLQGKILDANKYKYSCVITGRDDLLEPDIDRGLIQGVVPSMGARLKNRVYKRCVLSLKITDAKSVEMESCVLDEKFSSNEFIKDESLKFAFVFLHALLDNPDEKLLKAIPLLATKETKRSWGKMTLGDNGNAFVSIQVGEDKNTIRVYDLECNVWSRPQITLVSVAANDSASQQIAVEYSIYSDLLKIAPSLLPKGGTVQSGNDIWSSRVRVNKQKDGQYEVSLDVDIDDGITRKNRKLIGVCTVNADGSVVWSSQKIRIPPGK